jgi:8-oxo-dGTP pyrophosphatase MutT (NUDIX family)
MADRTASRGWLYPPCGSPTPSDFCDGKLDVDGSLIRETLEETGIVLAREQLGPALIITDEARIVYVRPVRLDVPASNLIAEINRFIANQPEPELESVKIVTSRNDLDEKTMPPFVSIYVKYAFGR